MKNTEIVCINAFLNIALQKFEGGSLDIKQCHNMLLANLVCLAFCVNSNLNKLFPWGFHISDR